MLFSFKVGSVTNAQRGAKILKSKGYRPVISRIEVPQSSDGCGYVIKVKAEQKENVLRLLKGNGITVLGVEAL